MKKGVDHVGITICYFCHDGQGRYLFQKRGINCRDEHGVWAAGAGALELHDTVENTLRKEIREEFCAEVLESEYLGFRDVHRTHDGERTHWIALDFKVRLDPSEVTNGEPHKFDEIGWFRLDDRPSPEHSQTRDNLEKYKDRL